MTRSLLPIVLLITLFACGGAYVTPGYIEPAEGGEHLIVIDRAYSSAQAWRESPWYRLDDEPVVFPVFVMLDGGANGCVVPPDVYALQPQRIACPSGWRRPRLR